MAGSVEPERQGILDQARDVFGTDEAAQRFLIEPAMALDWQRPLDLMATDEGAGLVATHLARLDHCVFT